MPTLNLDIFTLVLEHLPRQESLHFATVCKTVYTIVIRDVLSSVSPDCHSQLCDFIEFVLAAPSKRIPLLCELTFSAIVLSPEDESDDISSIMESDDQKVLSPLCNFASFLTEVLTQSNKLHSLSLAFCQYFFQRHPELRAALTEYQHMKNLVLFDLDEVGLQVIKDMKSSLRSISIESCPLQDTGEPLASFIPCMAAHRELEEVSFLNIEIDEFAVDDETQVINWPLVKSLKVRGGISRASLVKAFPNLRTLRFSDWSSYDVLFERFSEYQWPILDYLKSTSTIIRSWSLQTNVRWQGNEDVGAIWRSRLEASLPGSFARPVSLLPGALGERS